MGPTGGRAWVSVVFAGVLTAVLLMPGVSFGLYVADPAGDVPGSYADILGVGFTADASNYHFSMGLNGAIGSSSNHTNYFILIDSAAGGGTILGIGGIDYLIRIFHDSSEGDKNSVTWSGQGNQSGLFRWAGAWTAMGPTPDVIYSKANGGKTLKWDVSRFLPGDFTFAGATDTTTGGDDVCWFKDTTTPTPTPIPGAAWLLGSGLVGLVGLRRRSRKQA